MRRFRAICPFSFLAPSKAKTQSNLAVAPFLSRRWHFATEQKLWKRLLLVPFSDNMFYFVCFFCIIYLFFAGWKGVWGSYGALIVSSLEGLSAAGHWGLDWNERERRERQPATSAYLYQRRCCSTPDCVTLLYTECDLLACADNGKWAGE